MAQSFRSPSMTSQRTTGQKHSMPHVSTLFQAADLNMVDSRRSLSSQISRNTIEIQRSAPSSPRRNGLNDRKSILLVTTPENTIVHRASSEYTSNLTPMRTRQYSSEGCQSATSSGRDSVFDELPTVTFESPTSSTNVSFVAELEDTSCGYTSNTPTILTRVPSTTSTTMMFKSNKITSRAIIKVVDETIAAIESSNRELTARAEAAETAAYRLREENTRLQIELDECKSSYAPRYSTPQRCIATQTSPRHSPQNSAEMKLARRPTPQRPTTPSRDTTRVITPNEVSPVTVNVNVNDPERKRSIQNLRFLYRNQLDTSVQPLRSNPSPANLTIKTKHQPTAIRPRTADPVTTAPPRPSNSPPLPPLPKPNTTSQQQQHNPRPSTSTTLSTSPTKSHTHTHSDSHSHTTSLSSSSTTTPSTKPHLLTTTHLQTSKPLPPLGPMSPSVIQGVVEIGLCNQDTDNDNKRRDFLGYDLDAYKTGKRRVLKGSKSWGRLRGRRGEVVGVGFLLEGRDRDREGEKDREWGRLWGRWGRRDGSAV